MKHIGTETIESHRLVLRRFTMDDAQPMFDNWANDIRVVRYLTWPAHTTIQETKHILGTWIESYEKKSTYQWAIEIRDTKEIIGSISVVNSDKEAGMVEIGFCLGYNWWHKGYCSEALNAVIAFFFTKTDVNRIQCLHDVRNENSGKVMEKCGMKKEGTLRMYMKNNSGVYDYNIYSVIRGDMEVEYE